MSDFLTHIAARALASPEAVRPRTRARFEPPAEALPPEPFAMAPPEREASVSPPHATPTPLPPEAAIALPPPKAGPEAPAPRPVGTSSFIPGAANSPAAPRAVAPDGTEPGSGPTPPMRPPAPAAPPASSAPPTPHASSDPFPEKTPRETLSRDATSIAQATQTPSSPPFSPASPGPSLPFRATAPSFSRESRSHRGVHPAPRPEDPPSPMRPLPARDVNFGETAPPSLERAPAHDALPRVPSPEPISSSPMLTPHPSAIPMPAPAASPPDASPAIHVSIGRVVVRAVTPPAPAQRKEAASSNVMTLDDYLSRRKRRGRA